jgi:hypothetical protein
MLVIRKFIIFLILIVRMIMLLIALGIFCRVAALNRFKTCFKPLVLNKETSQNDETDNSCQRVFQHIQMYWNTQNTTNTDCYKLLINSLIQDLPSAEESFPPFRTSGSYFANRGC